MTFTKTTPTKPGFYAWRCNSNSKQTVLDVYKIGDGSLSVDFPVSRNFNCNVEKLKGEWCRLVPAEEVEKLQQRNDKLSAAIKKFVHRCEIGEIRSRKTYAEFCALHEESAQRK